MEERQVIHNYLKSLSKYLSRLDKIEADEVIREIESHIHDALDLENVEDPNLTVDSVLAGFGNPRDLAEQYVQHILNGTPPPQGFAAIQKVKKGATRGLYLATGFMGYGLASIFLFLGIAKLAYPQLVGVWANEGGHSFALGYLSEISSPATTELFGWWLVPIAIVTSVSLFYLTHRLLGVLRTIL